MRHAPDCGRELLGPPLDPLLVGMEWYGMVWNDAQWCEIKWKRCSRGNRGFGPPGLPSEIQCLPQSAPFLRVTRLAMPLSPLSQISFHLPTSPPSLHTAGGGLFRPRSGVQVQAEDRAGHDRQPAALVRVPPEKALTRAPPFPSNGPALPSPLSTRTLLPTRPSSFPAGERSVVPLVPNGAPHPPSTTGRWSSRSHRTTHLPLRC